MPNGLIGKLTLDVSGVMKSIDELKKGLANLGKGGGAGNGNITLPGVDALKKQLEGVSTQLTKIDEQLKNLGKGGGGSGGTAVDLHAQAIEKATAKLVEMEQIQQRLNKNNLSSTGVEQLTARYEKLNTELQRYTSATIEEAKQSTEYKKEYAKTLDTIEQALKKVEQQEQKAAEAQAKAAEKENAQYQKQIELAEKKAQALAHAQKQSQLTATFKEEQTRVNELIKLYTDYERIQQRLASSSVGAAEREELQAQARAIQDKINNSERYTDAQRQAAQSSEKVQAAVNKTAQAQAKAADTSEKAAQRAAQQAERQAQGIENLTNRIVSMFSTMVLMKGIRELWQNATSYAKEYYDQLNEIQVVTMKSQAEIDALSSKYRQMGQDMSVSSKDIASAATTFYRQGLNDAEVEQRLTYTTQYAKVAAIDFKQAAELITATANSMSDDIQGNIQRVVDVFVYLGDNAGTSAEEVGTAMQKAAAAAGTFGMSFEWLGAYIATVSETTRQAAEVVGTSLNSIIARLHSIRTTGYNSDDETKINDVAKALNTINVALLDQEGNWRDMTDIFNDIAAQWDTLDGKQQSYIATTIAGVRQQNTFLALMNDLSKGAEGGSRAWELYEGAMNSAGTVMEKYAIWEQSVEAANGRLQASLEGLYNSFSFFRGEFIVGMTDAMARLVDNIAAATQATGGLNILVPALGAVAIAFATGTLSVKTFDKA